MYVSLNQTEVMKVKTMGETRCGKTTSKTEISKINIEVNEETGSETESCKPVVEMESDDAVEVQNDKTAVETRNYEDSNKVKCDKFPQVISTIPFSSLSERLTTFLKPNPPTAPLSENASVSNAKDCATIAGHSVTSECQAVVADPDMSVSAVLEEPRHKNSDTIIRADTMQGPRLCDATSADMLPVVCDFGVSASHSVCTNSVVAKTVITDLETDLSNVKVKEEKPSGYGDTDFSAFAVSIENRLQEPGEVKMDPEVMP
jgi:hypothetical protein